MILHPPKFSVVGKARVVAYDRNGNIEQDSGFTKNAILKSFVNRALLAPVTYQLFTTSILKFGSGQTPTDIDTMDSLELPLRSSTSKSWLDYYNSYSYNKGAAVASPDGKTLTRTTGTRFQAKTVGNIIGTIREVGLDFFNENLTNKVSTRLVLDTPVVGHEGNQIYIFYEITIIATLADPFPVTLRRTDGDVQITLTPTWGPNAVNSLSFGSFADAMVKSPRLYAGVGQSGQYVNSFGAPVRTIDEVAQTATAKYKWRPVDMANDSWQSTGFSTIWIDPYYFLCSEPVIKSPTETMYITQVAFFSDLLRTS